MVIQLIFLLFSCKYFLGFFLSYCKLCFFQTDFFAGTEDSNWTTVNIRAPDFPLKLLCSTKVALLTKKSRAHQEKFECSPRHQEKLQCSPNKVGVLTKKVSAWSPNIGAQQKGFCQSSKIFLCLPKNSLQLKAFLLKMHLESSWESILRYHLVAVIEVFEAQISCYLIHIALLL